RCRAGRRRRRMAPELGRCRGQPSCAAFRRRPSATPRDGKPAADPDRLALSAGRWDCPLLGCGGNTGELTHVNLLVPGRFTSLRGQAGLGDSVPPGYAFRPRKCPPARWSAPPGRLRLVAGQARERRHGGAPAKLAIPAIL